jgi:hypothetical protein
LLLDKILQKTPGSATIIIMPRQGEIIEVTTHNGHSYRLSLFTPYRRTGRRNTINGGGIAEGKERG